MALYDINNGTGGMDNVMISLAMEIPGFIPFLLLFVFAFVFIAGSTAQRRSTGYSDSPLWATISSVCTLMVALPLTLTAGLIQGEILAIVVVITLLSGFWLFMSKGRNEV